MASEKQKWNLVGLVGRNHHYLLAYTAFLYPSCPTLLSSYSPSHLSGSFPAFSMIYVTMYDLSGHAELEVFTNR